MIRENLVNECLRHVRKTLPYGPWALTIFNSDLHVVERKIFLPDEEAAARSWALKHLQRSDRAVGFCPNPTIVMHWGGIQ